MSYEVESGVNLLETTAFAGTGLSRARDVDAGALSYEQAFNLAPRGPMITQKQALEAIEGVELTPINVLLLLGAAYVGRKQLGDLGVVLAPLALLGLIKLFEKKSA
jgi:hypothetical protein